MSDDRVGVNRIRSGGHPMSERGRRNITVHERVRLVELDGSLGFTVPCSKHQLCVVGNECWWHIYATQSGYKFLIWDERPNRGPHPGGGLRYEHQEWVGSWHDVTLDIAELLWDALKRWGMTPIPDDFQQISEAMSRVDLVLEPDGVEVVRITVRVPKPPGKKRKPRITQKILDGGEDMTV